MKSLITSALLAACIAAPVVGYGCPVVDQSNGPGSNGFSTSWLWQQEVTAGKAGLLLAIDLYVLESPAAFWLDVYATAGVHNDMAGDRLLSTLVDPEPHSGWNAVDVQAAGLELVVGQRFTFGIRGATAGSGCCGLAGTSSAHDHPLYDAGGLYYYDGRMLVSYPSNDDLAFRTVMEVGEPGALTLASTGAGLALLVGGAFGAPLRQRGRRCT